jgi:hypothetical protein
MYPSLVSAHSHGRHGDINVILHKHRTRQPSKPCPTASESSDDGHQSRPTPPKAFCCLRCHRGCSFDWRANETASVDEAQTRAMCDDCWIWCAYTTCDGRLGGVNVTINLFRPRFDWLSRRWEEEGTWQSTVPKVDTEEKKEVKSEDTTITLSRGCSKPLAVDHTTINIKSKGSGRWMCRMKTQCKTTINCEEGNWICRYVRSLHFAHLVFLY